MWKKLDTPGAQPELTSNEKPDLAVLGSALVESLVEDPTNNGNPPKNENPGVVPKTPPIENRTLPPSGPNLPSMKAYTEAVNEFSKNASAFIEHLPLLAKARTAYEDAMRASTEMRKVLDSGEENLRNLMIQLEQGVRFQSVKPISEKKSPEGAKLERVRGPEETGARQTRWP
jgi:hypothetical protein